MSNFNAQNIYDAFREVERLRELVDKYHKELKRKDQIIMELKNLTIEEVKGKQNDERK